MVALKWNNTGERFFETGVDRGVLYVDDRPGVPWNGLVGVSQSPTGGEPTPYYNDGLKFINLTTAEEFEATLEALSSPYEFDECDGTGTLGNGLFVTQQIRKQFHLSYRTRVGNDVDGLDHGYKIHLVYNALAGPSPRSYTTLNDSPEAMTLSWGITTIPAIAEGFKPTAHYVIDSRRTPKALLRYFESMLYGDEENQPTMPSAQEVTTLFTSPGPIAIRNLAKNPVGSTSLNTTSWRVSAGEVMTYITDEEAPAISVTDTTGAGAAYVDPITDVGLSLGVAPDKWIAFGVDVKAMDLTTAKLMSIRISPYGSLVFGGGQTSYGKQIELGEFTRLAYARPVTAAPVGAYARTLIWPGQEYLNEDPYFLRSDGWHVPSYIQPRGTGLDAGQGSLLIPATVGQIGSYNIPNHASPSQVMLDKYAMKGLPGEKLNVTFTVKSEIEIVAKGVSAYLKWYDTGDLPGTKPSYRADHQTVIPANTNTLVSLEISAPTTEPIGEWLCVVGIYKQSAHLGTLSVAQVNVRRQTEFRFRNAVVAVGDTQEAALAMVANPVSGDMEDSPNAVYEWEGTPNNSYSTLQSWGEF